MKRICFISPTAYGYFSNTDSNAIGGAERQIYLITKSLKRWYDIHVVVGNFGQPKRTIREGIVLHRGHLTRPVGTGHRIRKAFDLANAMRRSKADIFVCRNPPQLAAITQTISKLLDTPWVYHIANDKNIDGRPQELSKILELLFQNSIKNASAVISQTTHQKEILLEKYGKASTVIPNGYTTPESTYQHSNRSKFTWVGRFDKEQKRPHIYLDVAENNPEYRFDIIGGGSRESQYVQNIISRSKDISNVVHRGVIDSDKIHEEYKKSYTLVNTSAYEGFPNTFLEAWRCKTPVISLSIDPNRFVSTTPKQPYPDGDLDCLDSIITELATSTSYRESLGIKAYEEFKKKYTIERVVNEYRKIIESNIY